MKQDPEYLKALLKKIQEAPDPWPCISDLVDDTIEANETMLFHLELLEDDGFVVTTDDMPSFGFEKVGGGSTWVYRDAPVRLTSKGHQFIEAMDQPELWNQIKQEAPKASVATMFEIAKFGLMASAKASGEALRTHLGLG